MKQDDRRDGITDPLLAAAMGELRAEVVEVDWSRLRSSINERATLPLARRRSARRFGMVGRRFVPVALAAGVAFALWLGPGVYQQAFGPPAVGVAAALDSDEILVQALGGDLSEQEFRLLVTGRANPEVLLAVAVGRR